MQSLKAASILTRFTHLDDGGTSRAVAVDQSFWQRLANGGMPELDRGRLMTAGRMTGAWSSWERHPAGDEVVMLLSGQVDLVLDMQGQEQTVPLAACGDYVLVPAGVWHTARTDTEAMLLFITPGEGTEHKPVAAPAGESDAKG